MSVRPVTFYPNGDIDVVYDEQGHSGTIPAAEVQWTTNMDSSHNHNFLILACPDGCGASSTHPVGGGAAPAQVQEMFVRKVEREGCVCEAQVQARAMPSAIEHVKHLVTEMDGEDRWQVDMQSLFASP